MPGPGSPFTQGQPSARPNAPRSCPKCGAGLPEGVDICYACYNPASSGSHPHDAPGVTALGRTVRPAPEPKPPRLSTAGRAIGLLAVVVVVAAVVVGVLYATRGAGSVVQSNLNTVSADAKAKDLAAQSLVRSAMLALQSAYAAGQDLKAVTGETLQGFEPAIHWLDGASGVCKDPPAGATAESSAVSWAVTATRTYELGTWSTSGKEFGVRVDLGSGGGSTYYADGVASTW